MQLNLKVIEEVRKAQKYLVVVTKYLDKNTTDTILSELQTYSEVIGVGENRTETLAVKNLPKKWVHYIGRIQSRKIPEIIAHCSVVHSLAHIKHAKIFSEKLGTQTLDFFIQVNVSGDPHKEGIAPQELPDFLEAISEFKNLNIRGLSAMGWGDFSTNQKRKEFQDLIDLKNQYLPNTKTSAGTSRDYPIALEAGIDIVRVGQACFMD